TKGLATIKLAPSSEGAKVLLVQGTERRPLPTLPITVDIPTAKAYQIVAEKKGMPPFVQRITFEDGHAEKTFVIDMTAASAPAPEPAPTAEAEPPAKSAGGHPAPAPKGGVTPAPKKEAPSGNGTLNLNSIPVSNVILDGRPLGPTPKAGVSVAPGPHT